MASVTSISQVLSNGSRSHPALARAEQPALRPEAELMLLCSRTYLRDAQKARVSFILSETIDTEYFFDRAYHHGVLPLVCNNLLQTFPLQLDPETARIAEELGREHTLRNLFMTSKLVEILRVFDAAGIASVPFKGPTLAARAYKNISLRQFIDLDILVMRRDFDRAVDLLLESGYTFHPNSAEKIGEVLRIDRRKDVSLVHPDDNLRVELHWKLSGSYFSLPLQLSNLWSRMETTVLGGAAVNTLPFNDLFVYLCLHAARHGFERLEWICDLNELIRNEETADWAAIRSHARIHGCERVLDLALVLVADLFDTRPADPEFYRAQQRTLVRKTAQTIRERLFSETEHSNGLGEWYGYHLMLKEKVRDRVKLHLFYSARYLRLIFRPNSADKMAFPLPSSFFPLYFVLRPARLLFNYFSDHASKR